MRAERNRRICSSSFSKRSSCALAAGPYRNLRQASKARAQRGCSRGLAKLTLGAVEGLTESAQSYSMLRADSPRVDQTNLVTESWSRAMIFDDEKHVFMPV